MIEAVFLVTVVVPEYEAGIDFFVGVLGWRLVEDTPVPEQAKRWVVVAPQGEGGARVLLARASTPQQAARIGDQTGGRVAFFVRSDDFAADYQRLRDAGVAFVREPVTQPYGTVAVFRDPWGNLWDLVTPGTDPLSLKK